MSEQTRETLLEEPGTAAVFRELFLQLYDLREPLLPLERVMHWSSTIRRLGVSVPTLDRAASWITGGYFYGTTSSAPSAGMIAEAFEMGEARGADAYLVPAVRQGGGEMLAQAGFAPVPWFIECVYEMRDGVDADLRAQLGKERCRNIVRLARKAERDYEIAYYSRDDVRADPAILDTVAALHECNVRKYGHALNFYSKAILERILDSALGDKLLLCVRRDRETGIPVQTYICFLDRARSEMYNLVQGIAQDKVRPGHNLYVDHAYRLLKYAEEAGVRVVNFGRGAQEQKLHLGANRFFLLDNWLRHAHADVSAEISCLAEGTRAALGVDAEGRGAVGEFPLE